MTTDGKGLTMIWVLRLVLMTGLFVAGVTSLLATSEPPSYAYGSLSVTTPFNSADYSSKLGVCKGEAINIRWEIFGGSNPRVSASPPQNIEPTLPSTPVNNTGETTVTIKDAVTISLNIDDAKDGYQTQVQVVVIPEGICTGFPLELRGNYTGTLEQVTPQVASLPHGFSIRWNNNNDTLGATLTRGSSRTESSNTTFEMSCTVLDQEDKLTCVYDPSGTAILTLEGTVTATGYQGSYQGVLEGATFQTPTSGTFNFVKQ